MAENKTAAPWELPYPSATGEVKLGPEDFKELAERATVLFKEKVLIVKKYAGSGTLASGELAVQEETGKTFTLPAVGTANQIIGMATTVAELKGTAGAEAYLGYTKSATWKLTTGQVAVFQSDGTHWWLVEGEVKKEGVYSASVAITENKEETPSATRPVMVVVNTIHAAAAFAEIYVGGVDIASVGNSASGGRESVSFICPAGVAWKWKVSSGVPTVNASYYTL